MGVAAPRRSSSGWARCHDELVVRVVVVEDDDRIRTLLRIALEDEGYLVAEAGTGEAGLEAMRTTPADLMIVDLMLGGGMDGFSCVRQVRRFTDVPVIIVSARADTHDVVAGLEAGADDYVTKPFRSKRSVPGCARCGGGWSSACSPSATRSCSIRTRRRRWFSTPRRVCCVGGRALCR